MMESIKTTFFSAIFKKKMLDIVKITVGGALTFIGIGISSNNEKFYESFVMPAFQLMEAENAHKFSIFLAKYRIVPPSKLCSTNFLESSVLGLRFPNAIGVAAGYDKNGEAVEGLFQMGFGFVEVGSVTPEPQPGNQKPRVFRLLNIGGIINRYGFNSDGHDAVLKRLSKLEPHGKRKGVLGVNLGKNKNSTDPVSDYVLGVQKFGPVADYLVINVSSPNTPGLRDLQKRKELKKLTSSVIEERNKLANKKPPLFLKVSPDLSYEDKKDIADIVLNSEHKVDGLIISNTTISRPPGVDFEHITEAGGLSGKPLKELAASSLKDFSRLTQGKVPIIAVGGISCGEDAKERIYNGASLIQIYSALALRGPPAVKRIAQELETQLRDDGFKSLTSAIGSNLH